MVDKDVQSKQCKTIETVNMSRSRPKRWSVRFELAPENPDHVRLHDHLLALADTDEASTWIRDTLVAALPNADADNVSLVQAIKNGTVNLPPFRKKTADEVQYMPPEDIA